MFSKFQQITQSGPLSTRLRIVLAAALLLIAATLFVSVSSKAGNEPGTQALKFLSESRLPSELAETSGLFCTDNQWFTVNDSGNGADVFSVSAKGEILKVQSLNDHNHDFEALTGNDDAFYIGDIGNNYGQRKHLIIRKMDRETGTKQFTIKFLLEGYEPGSYEPIKHDYDAEALVLKDGVLWLVSKSWASGIAKVYRLSVDERNQTVAPVASIANLPGVITGIDWDAGNKRFVVVGYKGNALSMFDPYLAVLNEDFSLAFQWPLDGYGQVEGVCVDDTGDVWFTQESSLFSSSRLVQVRVPVVGSPNNPVD